MSVIIERIRDETPYNWTVDVPVKGSYSHDLWEILRLLGQEPLARPSVDTTRVYFRLHSSLQALTITPIYQPTWMPEILINDSDTRQKLWKSLFGEIKIPRPQEGAVDRHYGILDRELPPEPDLGEKIEVIYRRVRGKHGGFIK